MTAFHTEFLVLIVMAICAEQFPVTAIIGIIIVVVILVMNSEFAHFPVREFALASCADMRKKPECAVAIAVPLYRRHVHQLPKYLC